MLVVDNSPEVIVLPVTLNIFFQASDDYYNRWEVATFARILRYISSFIAIGLPGFYISIANYHPEILPTPFMLSIVSAREGVPFPVVVEVLLLELAFELLREAGIRLPGTAGRHHRHCRRADRRTGSGGCQYCQHDRGNCCSLYSHRIVFYTK